MPGSVDSAGFPLWRMDGTWDDESFDRTRHSLFVAAGARRKHMMDCHYLLLAATGRQGRLVKRDKIEKYKNNKKKTKKKHCSVLINLSHVLGTQEVH